MCSNSGLASSHFSSYEYDDPILRPWITVMHLKDAIATLLVFRGHLLVGSLQAGRQWYDPSANICTSFSSCEYDDPIWRPTISVMPLKDAHPRIRFLVSRGTPLVAFLQTDRKWYDLRYGCHDLCEHVYRLSRFEFLALFQL